MATIGQKLAAGGTFASASTVQNGFIGQSLADTSGLAAPTAWSLNLRNARRYFFDLTLPLDSVELGFNPLLSGGNLHPVTNITGTGMAFAYANGAFTFTNASGTNEASVRMLRAHPFSVVEADVATQTISNAVVEWFKDSNNRIVVVFRASDAGTITISAQAIINGTAQPQGVIGNTPAAPYTIRVQMLGRTLYVFYVKNGQATYVGSYDFTSYIDLRDPTVIKQWSVNISSRATAAGSCSFSRIAQYMGGQGHADPRIASFEDGTPIQDANGWVTALMTTRGGAIQDAYQGIYRMHPPTGRFEMTGALFADRGDGIWHNDNAGHLMYDRLAGLWRYWTTGHSDNPASRWDYHGTSTQDPRLNVGTIPVTQMTVGDGTSLYEDFYPIWDSAAARWVATASKGASVSVRLESSSPAGPWTETATAGTNETGNLIVSAGGTKYILAGVSPSGYNVRNYSTLASIGTLTTDIATTASRVWPVAFPYVEGGATKLYMLTMDRGQISAGFSYGALYLYKNGA